MEGAVVSLAHGAMDSLLGKLGELLTGNDKLLTGAKGQILFLKAELESMDAFLKKISDAEEPDEQDKCWAKEVRELSYDIDDSITEFLHHVGCEFRNSPGILRGFMERCMSLLTTMYARYEIAKEFQGLKRRVVEVNERRRRYKTDVVPKPNNTSIDLRLLALHAQTSDLVGIRGPRDHLIKLMDEEDVPSHQLKVLSIVGFGGLGKTTLANEIFRKLKGKFHCCAFVSVSQKPNVRKILRTMLSQVGIKPSKDTNVETWEAYEFISELQKFLLKQRYFIVIDDIWDASAWDIIRCALPENWTGSRVITTTRIETVARSCCNYNSEYVYKMKPLSDQDSRSLFYRRIFGSEDECPPYLKDVSVGILKKCAGLPLAIITLSSLLASQPVKLTESWEYVQNSLGSNFDVSPSLEGMRKILNLSYINLPHYLKTCMLYLGIYPEDYTIDMVDLARQWVAEGFISKSYGIDPEYVAKSYFNELINRSMIQPVGTDDNTGEVMSCKIHDMMLDLILQKCREENFITVIDDVQDMTRQHDKFRRLSLNLDGEIDDIGLESIQLSQIRTVAGFRTSSLYLPRLTLFKHLRVLTIEMSSRYHIRKSLDLSGIYNLYQLRYIKVKSDFNKVVIPTEIVGMQLLETFHLLCSHNEWCGLRLSSRPGEHIDRFPSYIVHMRLLLHLIVPQGILLPYGIGNMKSLRTLHYPDFTSDSLDNVKSLKELSNLRDLKIERRGSFGYSDEQTVEKALEILRACLDKLCNLTYLQIRPWFPIDICLDILCSVPAFFCHLQRLHISGSLWFSRVPEWLSQLHGLYDLELRVKEVVGDDAGIISQLPSVVLFHLYIKGVPKDKIIIRGTGFPALKQFIVTCCRISYLTFEAGAMPKLESLKLGFNAQGWDRYGGVPAGIEYLSGLKEIIGIIADGWATGSNRRAAESALRDVADLHPSHPVSNIRFRGGRCTFDGMDDEPLEEEDSDEPMMHP